MFIIFAYNNLFSGGFATFNCLITVFSHCWSIFVLVRFCQLGTHRDISGKREFQLRIYLHQVVGIGGTSVVVLSRLVIDMGQPLWAVPFQAVGNELYRKANWDSHGKQTSKQRFSLTSVSVSALSSSTDFPSRCTTISFLYRVEFGHGLYHSSIK